MADLDFDRLSRIESALDINDWTVFDSVDPTAPEVLTAMALSDIHKKKSKEGAYFESYSEIRAQFGLDRARERRPDLAESVLGLLYFKYHARRLRNFFTSGKYFVLV